ncbi:hypothetical protein [Endozoicomonas ascidiicola]|uniref:hypothetical protein n=1 Tax=Endozoicomonas ascidiicola TaxID=1698521 RepID=UPI00082C0E5F|nr:hypothetical protein [Endozoicomonas ascidiicola]
MVKRLLSIDLGEMCGKERRDKQMGLQAVRIMAFLSSMHTGQFDVIRNPFGLYLYHTFRFPVGAAPQKSTL